MEIGSGYSIEAQVTGEEVAGGIQFEITPVHDRMFKLRVGTLHQNKFSAFRMIKVRAEETFGELHKRLTSEMRLTVGTNTCIYLSTGGGKQPLSYSVGEPDPFEHGKTLEELGFSKDSILLLAKGREEMMTIFVRTRDWRMLSLPVSSRATIEDLQECIEQVEGLRVCDQRLLHGGKQLGSRKRLDALGIHHKSTLGLVKGMRGGWGGSGRPPNEMSIAAGGMVYQSIVRDTGIYVWDAKKTVVFNVQIINSVHCRTITGQPPPETPVNAAVYATYGYPFFKLYEEPTGVSGDFIGVRSVAQIDGREEAPVEPKRIVKIGRGGREVGFFSPGRPLTAFQSDMELEERIRKKGRVIF